MLFMPIEENKFNGLNSAKLFLLALPAYYGFYNFY